MTELPDARKPLTVLSDEWSTCTACDLGVTRQDTGGAFVFGDGHEEPKGILFIGDGPGTDEEAQGLPFVGHSGQFLRAMLNELDFQHVYMTNLVCCRSWDYVYDTQGNRLTRKNYRTKQIEEVARDEPPKPSQVQACKPRLFEQIYILDPALIVALGSVAAESLVRNATSIQAVSGSLFHMTMPGAAFVPCRTPKGLWARKYGPKDNRRLIAPIERNEVVYPVIPLIHPGFALASKNDRRPGSPMDMFVRGLQTIRNVYSTYINEIEGGKRVEYTLPEGAVERSLDEDYYE